MTKTFPFLYKLGENSALIQWSVSVESLGGPGLVANQGIIITSWGQEGKATQSTREVIAEGKNVGKKNETSPYEQAVAEAKAKWEKQQKAKKYVVSREAALAGERSDLVEGGVDCMLAFPIEKKPKALKFPCAIQRKYDGHRILAHVKDGICTLWTRSRKQMTSMPHIARALVEHFPTGEYWFDGEGYVKGISFEELTSFLRTPEPQPSSEKVEYHVYDMVSDGTYDHRLRWLSQAFFGAKHPLVLAPTAVVSNETEMQDLFEKFLEAGYEGAMARNLNGLYVGKRSPDLLKLKKFQDAEFECVATSYESRQVTDSAGTRMVTYPVFTCVTADGKTFNTPMMGKLDVVNNIAPKMVGKKLTVKYQDLTKEGVPRFPKAREYVAL